MAKVRIYSFDAGNTETRQVGTYFLTAKNLDEAEKARWLMHASPLHAIVCNGYVGPMKFGGWSANPPRGFVSSEVTEAEFRAAQPVVEHDPKMLAEFVERTGGRQPKRGNVLRRNVIGGGGVFEIHPSTSACCDPSTETYWSM
jgi:hypothetical protein